MNIHYSTDVGHWGTGKLAVEENGLVWSAVARVSSPSACHLSCRRAAAQTGIKGQPPREPPSCVPSIQQLTVVSLMTA